MIITDVKPYPVWGGNRNFFFVKIETDAGLYGIGEGGLTWRELACAEAVRHLKPFLVGQDASRIEHLWQLMFRGGFFPADRVVSSAIAAIDIALWDLRGKQLGVPVYDLLGGLVDEGPPLRVQLGAQDGEALAWLYRNGRIVERTDSEEGVELGVRLDRQAVGRFERRWPGALQ